MNDYIYLDLETSGLLPEIHTIHCMAICNTESEPKLYVGHEQIKRVLSRLDVSRHILVAHNGCAFDFPALWKVLGFKWKGKVEDTMLMSTLDNPDGKHSLKDWGEKLKCPKDDYQERCKEQGIDPWGEYNDEMGRYCVQDVATLKKVHQALLSKLKGKNWANPLALEQAFANWFMLQSETGVQVDLDHCVTIKAQIEKEMEDIADTVEPLLPPVELNKGDMKKLTPPKIQFLKSGKPSKASYKFFDEIVEKDGWHGIKNGVEVKLPHHEPVGTNRPAMMKDDVHLKNWLMDSGWVPSYWNYKKEKDERGKLRFAKDKENNLVKASPKMTKEGQFCPSLEKLINDGGIDDSVKLAARWFILRHRLGLVKGVVSRVRSDGRVSATGHSYGTPTTRVRHVAPVCNIPKADPSILLGKEMRAMFCAKPGNVLVGVDASGLELRCLAHYMDDESFTQTVLHGKKRDDKDYAGVDEIHTLLWEVCKEHVASRSIQKNVTYCVPMDTRALTRKGWKHRHELSVGDEVLTYNSEKGVKEWAPIEAIHDTRSEVLHLHHGHGFSVRATADHRWFVKQRHYNQYGSPLDRGRYLQEEVRTTEELNTESCIITNAPMSPDVDGAPIEWEGKKYGRDWTAEVCSASSDQRKAFLAGFLIADGHMNPKTGHWCFNQLRNEHYEAALTAAYIEHSGSLYVRSSRQDNGKEKMDVKFSKKGHVTMQRMKKESLGTQDVWCITTRNGSWVMRQGDCITITGNCFLYGGGDKKLGLTAGASEGDAARVGGEIRQALAVGLPKLGVLMEQCEAWGRKGRIIAIDGRPIPIRMPHATLNMLLQSCGSIIVKAATVWMCKQVYKRKLRGRMVIHMHDEVQWDCHPDDAEEIGQLFVKGMKWAERYFNIKCPLDGDVEMGHTWADTH